MATHDPYRGVGLGESSSFGSSFFLTPPIFRRFFNRIFCIVSIQVKAGKHKQAEELLGEQTNRSDAIVLMQAQVALAAKDLEKACSLLEELLRNSGGDSRDHGMQETIIGTLADLFVKTANPQKAIETLEEFCERDVEITADGKQGALRLMAGLLRKHGLW